MAVYTVVEKPALETFLGHYGVGRLLAFSGIEAGIENTNYFVSTSAGEFVLTLFETAAVPDLHYFLDVMAYFAEHGVPSAHPIADESGQYLRCLHEKPAALVLRLPGASQMAPGAGHCRAVGRALAQMHLAGMQAPVERASDRGAPWRAATLEALEPQLGLEESETVRHALDRPALESLSKLPGGVIHADLFRDNALFDGETLTGIIDFYYAFNGPLIYDLMVTLADWCFTGDAFDQVRARALVEAYEAVRRPAEAELAAARSALLAAGLRFWLSRRYDASFPRDGELVHVKDPAPFLNLMRYALNPSSVLESLFSDVP